MHHHKGISFGGAAGETIGLACAFKKPERNEKQRFRILSAIQFSKVVYGKAPRSLISVT
jgi:hypothetical protein